jgi:hypothetical protein
MFPGEQKIVQGNTCSSNMKRSSWGWGDSRYDFHTILIERRTGEVKKKWYFGFGRFFVNILIFLGSAPCVTKEKWKNGKMESKERHLDFLVFLPFFPAFPFFLRRSLH